MDSLILTALAIGVGFVSLASPRSWWRHRRAVRRARRRDAAKYGVPLSEVAVTTYTEFTLTYLKLGSRYRHLVVDWQVEPVYGTLNAPEKRT